MIQKYVFLRENESFVYSANKLTQMEKTLLINLLCRRYIIKKDGVTSDNSVFEKRL
jgi:hypothetical protein